MNKGQVDLSNQLVGYIDDEIHMAKDYLDFYESHKEYGEYEMFLEIAKEEFRHAEKLLKFGMDNKVFDKFTLFAQIEKLYGLQGKVEEV